MFFFSSRRRHTRYIGDWSSDVCSSDLGVGRAIARAFGAAGAKVGLIARGIDGLNAAAGEVRRAGGEALVLPCDVSHAERSEERRVGKACGWWWSRDRLSDLAAEAPR